MPDFEVLELDTLGKLDPHIPAMFRRLIARGTEDCMDRPTLTKRRTITMQIDLIPVYDEASKGISDVAIEVLFKGKIPNFVSNLYGGTPTKKGIKFIPKGSPHEEAEKE